MEVVRDALEAAAGADHDFGGIGRRQSVSRQRVAAVRRTICRFLENLPEDLTVLELRRIIEEGEEAGRG